MPANRSVSSPMARSVWSAGLLIDSTATRSPGRSAGGRARDVGRTTLSGRVNLEHLLLVGNELPRLGLVRHVGQVARDQSLTRGAGRQHRYAMAAAQFAARVTGGECG